MFVQLKSPKPVTSLPPTSLEWLVQQEQKRLSMVSGLAWMITGQMRTSQC